MPQLPTLDYEYTDREVTDTFAGYNHKLKIGAGEFYDTENLTSAYYPLLAERKKRGLVKQLTAPGGLLGKEELAYVDNGTLYYNGEPTALTGLTAGEKQLVSMGAYICVFPDKKYYNTADAADYGSMEAYYTSTGTVKYTMCRADGTEYAKPTVSAAAPEQPENAALWIDTSQEKHVLKQWSSATQEWVSVPTVYTRIQFISSGELPGLFSVYDGVEISGAGVEDVNGTKVIYALGGSETALDYIVVTGLLEAAYEQTTGTVSIKRTVPQMDYICESQNRLWGCYYGNDGEQSLNEIYCCALGDFKNWRQYMGLSTDSWTASVGSDGPWTGAVNYLGYPTFFKEDRIHRVSISAYGAHQINETGAAGKSAYAAAVEAGYTGTEATFYAALTAMPYHNARHLPDGADPITVKAGNIEASAVETAKIKDKAVTMAKLADHAVSVDYTATLNTTWSGSAAPYTKEQTINGILATDKPLIDIVPSATFADAEKQADAWALIYRAVTAANKITFYAKAKPTVSIPLQIRCIRK